LRALIRRFTELVLKRRCWPLIALRASFTIMEAQTEAKGSKSTRENLPIRRP